MGVSAFLIVTNEEKRIPAALDSLQWADELIVVDGGSIDRTREICCQKGAQVYQRQFDNFEDQRNYALSLVNQEWVFFIDADEVVTKELAAEIKSVVVRRDNCAGYFIPRRNRFLGQSLRFGRQGNERLLRLFRKQGAKFCGLVHETVQVDGTVFQLNNFIDHFGTEGLTQYQHKLKLYIDLEITKIISSGNVPSLFKSVFFPIARWIQNFILLGGFIDGRAGFLYHSLSCYYDWAKYLGARRYIKQQSHGKHKQ